jgi:hypothetical protein
MPVNSKGEVNQLQVTYIWMQTDTNRVSGEDYALF